MEQWAEIRRLHRSEQVPIKEIVRRLGVARNTVRAALAADEPPKYSRAARGSVVDAFEPQIRALLREYPTMPATVIAERIGWTRSLTVLKDRVRQIRPEYRGVDPADRVVYEPGVCSQWDLWFPDYRIPPGHSQLAILPVLVMTLAYSRYRAAVMIPSRQGGDILAGMWLLLAQIGAVTHKLVWDRESAIGGKGTPTALAAGFVGTLGTRLELAPPRDPEYKGMVERNNRFFETSFVPGRVFESPEDFNIQLSRWLGEHANTRVVRSIGDRRPADVVELDVAAMTALPPAAPHVGLTHRVRLGRDYYVRVAGNDYSVHPSVIGRFVDITADLSDVVIRCGDVTVADHHRSWANHVTIADPQHVRAAKELRRNYRMQDPAIAAGNAARVHMATSTGITCRSGRYLTTTTSMASISPRQPIRSATHEQYQQFNHSVGQGDSHADGVSDPGVEDPHGRCWAELADRARDEGWSHEQYLAAILERQVSEREANGTTLRIAAARFPAVKTMEDFTVDHVPSLPRDVIAHLATSTWIAKADNVILLGPPGVGKTHLAIALGMKAALPD